MFATVNNGHAIHAKPTNVGTLSGRVPGGTTGKLKIKLNATGRRLLKRGSMRVRAKGAVKNNAGLSTPLDVRVAITASKKH